MRKLVALALFVGTLYGLVGAASSGDQRNDPALVKAVEQLEQDMGDAMVAGDVEKLSQIYADDWKTIGGSGAIVTKEMFLRDFKSGTHRLESFELGPMDVLVSGNVAVVHGSVTEKRRDGGKDVSGEFLWMDLVERRAGKWVVVRSSGAKVK